MYVITLYRKFDSNYGVLLGKLVRRVGLTMWPRPFQNLRSTRETELAERFPMHVVCAWIGNSQLVAAKHDLQVTDDHFTQGVEDNALQNSPQQAPETSGNGSQNEVQHSSKAQRKPPDLQGSANDCEDLLEVAGIGRVGDEGLETPASHP